METEEEDDTNDEDFTVEIRQFSSCSHRFSKVSEAQQESGRISTSCHAAQLGQPVKASALCGGVKSLAPSQLGRMVLCS